MIFCNSYFVTTYVKILFVLYKIYTLLSSTQKACTKKAMERMVEKNYINECMTYCLDHYIPLEEIIFNLYGYIKVFFF